MVYFISFGISIYWIQNFSFIWVFAEMPSCRLMQKTLELRAKLEIALYVTHLSLSTVFPHSWQKNPAVHSDLIIHNNVRQRHLFPVFFFRVAGKRRIHWIEICHKADSTLKIITTNKLYLRLLFEITIRINIIGHVYFTSVSIGSPGFSHSVLGTNVQEDTKQNTVRKPTQTCGQYGKWL